MTSLGFASVPAIQQYLRLATALALDVELAISKATIATETLEDENGRVPGEKFQALIKNLIEQSGDSLLGLKSAEYVQPGSYSSLGYIVMSCATVKEAVEKIIPYEKLVGDMGTTTLTETKDELAIVWHCAYTDEDVRRHMIANVLASWFNYGQWLANNSAPPKRIEFQQDRPGDAEFQIYRSVFNCPVEFNQSRNAIVLEKSLLDLPLRQPDKLLRQTLEKHANQLLNSLEEESNSLSAQVSKLINDQIQQGPVRKEKIAESAGLNPRTMQRRLAAEGLTFQQLLDEIRRNLACEKLEDISMGVSEIAEQLGFADARSFHRSFKTWTGMTPGEYRQTADSAGSP